MKGNIMKKKTKEWIKENLLNYLNENNLTIDSSSWGYKKGIAERKSSFKSHYNDYVDEYIMSKFHLQSEESYSKKFFDYLLNKKEGNEDILLEFFKSKSPTNKTKIEKDGTVEIQDSSNDHYEYQKYITSFLTDQNMLFDYVGNLRFLGGEQEISFKLIKNVFTDDRKEALVEMYLNSSLLKNVEFERKVYELVVDLNLEDKYKNFFPNLKEGKKDFSMNDFNNKKTEAFIISFDKETLVKQVEINKHMQNIFFNIDNMVNIKKIEPLNIELMQVIKDNADKKTVIITGDNLNIEYIKVVITEYMRIALKEDESTALINKVVSAREGFDSDKSFNKEYQMAFIEFKERVQKIYLKEKLDKNLVKEEIIKVKAKKI